MLIVFARVAFFVFQIVVRMFAIRLPYFVVAVGVGSLVIFGVGKIMDLPLRPFEAIIIAFAAIFVFTVIFVLAVFPLGVFPPRKDE